MPEGSSALTAIDLFAGAGGLTQGLKAAGYTVIGAVEVEAVAAATYRLNHPEVSRVWGDIRTVKSDTVMQELQLSPGQLDLLAGCPPCQGYSRIRSRNRGPVSTDSRNNLIYQFLRFIRDLRPKAVMMENVPGLAKDRRMRHFLAFLRSWGYIVDEQSYRVQNAADYGVPQRRRRLILMASSQGPILFPKASSKRSTVRDAIGTLTAPEESADPLHNLRSRMSTKVAQIVKAIPKNGGSRRNLPLDSVLDCHSEFEGFHDVYGRMSWDDVAPTITAGCYHPSKGRFLHPEADRGITLREAAILQGFPPTYEFSLERGRTFAAAMIGNALPPPLVASHASMILELHRREP